MSAQDMKALRLKAGLTQAQMADRMGLGKSAYVDLEADEPDWKKFKGRHMLALERASMQLAIEREDIGLALPQIRDDALRLADLVRGVPPYQITAQRMGTRSQAGCATAAEAVRVARAFFDESASTVVITHDGRAYSLDQLRGEVEAGRLA